MGIIFHQNMLDYGGAAPARNAGYNLQFGNISAAITAALAPAAPVWWVAGFTEITNAGASVAALLARAGQLSATFGNIVVIEVGTTALGRREFLGIAWNNGQVPVAHVGQVLWNPVNNTWNAHNTAVAAIPANNVIPLPGAAGLGADTRGLAYVAGVAGGNATIFAFMHNMYNLGNKSSAFTNLGRMGEQARAAIGGGYAAAEVIIGGDFNLLPRTPKRPRGAQLTLNTRYTEAGMPLAPVNTTNANPYDYWALSNGAIANANTRVYVQTRVTPPCSDHAGIVLHR
jgi:hypothetical protein